MKRDQGEAKATAGARGAGLLPRRRHGLDFDEIAEVEVGDGDDGAGRFPRPKKLREDTVEGVPMVDADDVGADVEDSGAAGAGGGQHAVEIVEGEADLLLEAAVGGVGAVGQARQLTRGEHQPAIAGRGHVMGVGRQGAVGLDGGGLGQSTLLKSSTVRGSLLASARLPGVDR